MPDNEQFIVELLSRLASVQQLLIDNKQMEAAEVIEITALHLVGLASFFLRENGKANNPRGVENTIH